MTMTLAEYAQAANGAMMARLVADTPIPNRRRETMADEATIEVTDGGAGKAEAPTSDNRLGERELMTLHADAVRDAYGLMGAIAKKANDQNGEILSRLAETYCSLFNAVSDTVEVSTASTLHEAFFAPPAVTTAVTEPAGVETTDSDLDPSDTGASPKAKGSRK